MHSEQTALVGDHLNLEVGLARHQASECDVDPARGELVEVAEQQLAHRDLDIGVACSEFHEHPWQSHCCRRAVEADGELFALGSSNGLQDPAPVLEYLATLHEQRLTGAGELDAATGPLEQPNPDKGLEPRDLLAKRRLGDVQARGGTAEVQLLRNHDEVFDEAQIQPFHRRSLLVEGERSWTSEQAVCNLPGQQMPPSRLELALTNDSTAARMRPTLTDQASQRMLAAATAEAQRTSVPITVVAVDESGVMKALVRMDGAPLVSVQTAIDKAHAAAAIGMPPDDFFSAIETDAAAVASFANRPGLALIAGGLPVLHAGSVAGAIGVAGAMTAAQDRQIAEVAIAHAGAPE